MLDIVIVFFGSIFVKEGLFDIVKDIFKELDEVVWFSGWVFFIMICNVICCGIELFLLFLVVIFVR